MKYWFNSSVVGGAILLMAVALAGCKSESGERSAGCEGKQSVVTEKVGKNDSGHLMMYVSCNPADSLATWYVTWDEPEDDQAEYDRYAVGDEYP